MMQRLLLLALLLITGLAAGQQPLPAEQAFRLTVQRPDSATIEARWEIAPGYYLYRNKFSFEAEPAAARLGQPVFPTGQIHDDENFGKVEIYRDALTVRVPIVAGSDALARLNTVSQGCADMGICYPPQKVSVALPAQSPPAPAMSVAAAPLQPLEPEAGEDSRIARLLQHGSLWLVVTSFFGFGLLLSLTPCVLPMVPILSGIIVNHGHAVSHGRAFFLSLAYVLGMALTYALAGIAAGLSGTLLTNALQNAWVLGGFAMVFVVLSLSMFGFYELQLPTTLQSRLSERANRQGGSVGAIALMGILSALIVGPCVAAPLAGALLYIAKTGNAALGGLALFALALGMGAPLLAVGLFSRALLPKTGPWMEAVKKFFGVLLLATALWLVSPVLPAWTLMLGWAVLLIVPSIYLHALDPLPAHAHGWHKLWKGVGILMLIAGAAMLAGLLGGSRDPLQPLGFIKASSTVPTHGPRFAPVRSVAELDAVLDKAGKPAMLDFYADWCISCKEMERTTFSDPKVLAALERLHLLQADVTANSKDDRTLLERYGLFGPPGILFFDAQGRELPGLRVIGYQSPDQFLATLERASASL